MSFLAKNTLITDLKLSLISADLRQKSNTKITQTASATSRELNGPSSRKLRLSIIDCILRNYLQIKIYFQAIIIAPLRVGRNVAKSEDTPIKITNFELQRANFA